jgi:site-specific DNA-methyltransferase (adenine-specific)
MATRIITGDCRDVLPTLQAESVHAIVTDPPYHLTQVSRGGSARTNNPDMPHGRHRIGDKGFMGKVWDGGDVAFRPETWAAALRVAKPGAHLLAFGGTRTFHRLTCAIDDGGWEIRDCLMWLYGSGFPKSKNLAGDWDGWGTALKPAWEPIVMARKPFNGGVAANVAAHGTGALNIDGCRIDSGSDYSSLSVTQGGNRGMDFGMGRREFKPASGRWPANLIHDGSDEVVSMFPSVASGKPSGTKAGGQGNAFGFIAGGIPVTGYGDAGSAARFFYVPKASSSDRNRGIGVGDRNHHPTVKPTELMQYLIRLVTPPRGTVLDIFAGSGTTGLAADFEGCDSVLIELDPANADIARRRIAGDAPLFGDVECAQPPCL